MGDILKILDEILDEFDNWDKGLKDGIQVIESNEIRIEKLKEKFNIGELIGSVEYTSLYAEKMDLISNKQKRLLEVLDKEKQEVLGKINQLNKKNKVVNSYISIKTEPIFIDRDM